MVLEISMILCGLNLHKYHLNNISQTIATKKFLNFKPVEKLSVLLLC